jgi:hypothetical protein
VSHSKKYKKSDIIDCGANTNMHTLTPPSVLKDKSIIKYTQKYRVRIKKIIKVRYFNFVNAAIKKIKIKNKNSLKKCVRVSVPFLKLNTLYM